MVASLVTCSGASVPATLTGLKGFQGLDGQWKGVSLTESTDASGETDGLAAVVSSSEDSSLPASLAALVGFARGLGFVEALEGTS